MEITVSISLMTFLLGLWGGHYFSLLRDKRKEFNNTVDALRSHLMNERAEVLHMCASPSSFLIDKLLYLTPWWRRTKLQRAFDRYLAAKSDYRQTASGDTFMHNPSEAQEALRALKSLIRTR